jgi:hypothetical protein
LAAAMAATAFSGSGVVHTRHWHVAGDSKDLVSCGMTEYKASLQSSSLASIE